MSTRCLISFCEKMNAMGDSPNITIYKHMDGSPNRVLPLLRDFLKFGKPRLNDYEYASAGFLRFVQINEMDSLFRDEPFLSYGIIGRMDLLDDDKRGCEYLYIITPALIKVYSIDLITSEVIPLGDINIEKFVESIKYFYEVTDYINNQ